MSKNKSSKPLTLEMLDHCLNLNEDIPDVNSPSDVELDDNEEDIRPTSPLNNFDFLFNAIQQQSDAFIEDAADKAGWLTNNPDDPSCTDPPAQASTSTTVVESQRPTMCTDQTQPSISTAVVQPQKPKGKKSEPNRKWKKRKAVTETPDVPQAEDRLYTVFSDCSTATDIFFKLIHSVLENIIFQSNLYSTQAGKTLQLNESEFLVFIGINFLMGYHKLPSKHHYWSQGADLRVPVIADAMTRDRFDEILAFLHVNDNQKIPKNCTDKLYKLRPMIEGLNQSFFDSYDGTRQVSVDESIVLFKGRSSLKQYNPMKQIKRGYKLWCVADLKGYIFNLDIYQGRNEVLEEEFVNFGLGERVVLSLTKKFWGSKRIICFDNFFSSVALLERLKTEHLLACGTIRQTRRGLPENMISDKALKRGDYDYRVSEMGISFFKWQDNKAINFISNFHGTEETEVKRTQKDGTRKNIPCPQVVDDYNKFMGGVDQADRYRVLYGVDRKSKKWWHRIFFALLDIAFVNAYVIYCEMFGKTSVLEVRRQIAMGLITSKDVKTRKSQKRSSDTKLQAGSSKKRRKSGYSVLKDVRLGNLGAHWPVFTDKRGRCEFCSMNKVESKPSSICSLCRVHLCCNDKKNCFSKYHDVA